jgi:hypothetical protein
MADLNTAQRAPLTVTTSTGAVVPPAVWNAGIDPAGIVHIENEGGGEGQNYLVADNAGTALVTVTYAGQTGSLEVTVEAGPLTLTLGTPEPK